MMMGFIYNIDILLQSEEESPPEGAIVRSLYGTIIGYGHFHFHFHFHYYLQQKSKEGAPYCLRRGGRPIDGLAWGA